MGYCDQSRYFRRRVTMNKIKRGSIGVDLNDDRGKLFEVFHVGHEFVYFQYLNSPITGICKIIDFWVLM